MNESAWLSGIVYAIFAVWPRAFHEGFIGALLKSNGLFPFGTSWRESEAVPPLIEFV
jgi:hypothetical protein